MTHQQPATGQTLEERQVALQRLWFLADTPLFVDNLLVSRLYDAVFRPEVELAAQSEATTREVAAKVAASAKASAEIEVKPPFLSLFGIDVGKAKAGLDASLSGEGTGRRASTGTVNYTAVKSTERYLEKVVSLYAEKYSRRLFWVSTDLKAGHSFHEPNRSQTWKEMEGQLDQPGPRPLIVLDLAEGSKLMPMFGELTNGKGCELLKNFLELREKRKDDTPRPSYPRSNAPADEEAKARREYWMHVLKRFDSQDILRSIEEAAGTEKSRFDWIDFRTLLDLDKSGMNEPPHLHFMPRGEYSTGTFAYQLVRRGWRYGVRIIGTLKRGQDINVLAVYER